MKKVLITGVHGFVGSNLVHALKESYNIYGLDIVSPQNDGVSNTFGWKELEKIPSVDVIIHLAGKAHDTNNTVREQDYFDINLGLTKKIFDYYLNSNATKFIFFSSVKAVADSVKGDCLSEEVEPNPSTAYGKSKQEAEKYILGQTLPKDKQVYILRPCMIHGPGNKGNLNLLYKFIKNGIPYPLGCFHNKRSMLSVENLCFIIGELLNRDIVPGAYNVADDEPLSTEEIIRIIGTGIGKKNKIWRIPKKLIQCIAFVGDILHLPLNSERLKKLTENYVVSNKKLIKALKRKLPVSAKDGLLVTIQSFEHINH